MLLEVTTIPQFEARPQQQTVKGEALECSKRGSATSLKIIPSY
jgi:hypothetical protein